MVRSRAAFSGGSRRVRRLALLFALMLAALVAGSGGAEAASCELVAAPPDCQPVVFSASTKALVVAVYVGPCPGVGYGYATASVSGSGFTWSHKDGAVNLVNFPLVCSDPCPNGQSVSPLVLRVPRGGTYHLTVSEYYKPYPPPVSACFLNRAQYTARVAGPAPTPRPTPRPMPRPTPRPTPKATPGGTRTTATMTPAPSPSVAQGESPTAVTAPTATPAHGAVAAILTQAPSAAPAPAAPGAPDGGAWLLALAAAVAAATGAVGLAWWLFARRDARVVAGGAWTCPNCHSVNRPLAVSCYSCRATR